MIEHLKEVYSTNTRGNSFGWGTLTEQRSNISTLSEPSTVGKKALLSDKIFLAIYPVTGLVVLTNSPLRRRLTGFLGCRQPTYAAYVADHATTEILLLRSVVYIRSKSSHHQLTLTQHTVNEIRIIVTLNDRHLKWSHQTRPAVVHLDIALEGGGTHPNHLSHVVSSKAMHTC